MAKKTKPSEVQEEPQGTGTARVMADGVVNIPGPTLPSPSQGSDAKPSDKPKAAKAQAEPDFVQVTSKHLIAEFARNSEQIRDVRLLNLARSNRDVAWLLDAYNKLVSETKP